MRIEFLPWHGNLQRFPLEQRVPADLHLVRQLAPAADEVREVAAAFRLPCPSAAVIRRAARAEMGRHLAGLALPRRPWWQRRSTLEVLLAPRCETAVAACVAFEQALRQALVVQEAARLAEACGDRDATARLMDEAERDAAAAGAAFLLAARRCEELEGAVKAVRAALRGESQRS